MVRPPIPRRPKFLLGIVLAIAGAVFAVNSSHFATPLDGRIVLLAHRGLGQDYDRRGLTNETCTAERLVPSGHALLENTLASMQAAFELGADVVEFDVQRTSDNRFAVFHDWTVDCRTEGSGITRQWTLDSLQRLDIGYGYTADGGRTFPYRGRGTGLMPSLEQVLATFPSRRLLIDLKSNVPADGVLLAERLGELPAARQKQLMVYGGGLAVREVRNRLPHVRTIWPARLKQCLLRYVAIGWSGRVPSSCAASVLMVPANVAPWLWGWPTRFVARMRRAGSSVFLVGDYHGEPFSTPFDDPARLHRLPAEYTGGVWTDRIDLLGPALADTAVRFPR